MRRSAGLVPGGPVRLPRRAWAAPRCSSPRPAAFPGGDAPSRRPRRRHRRRVLEAASRIAWRIMTRSSPDLLRSSPATSSSRGRISEVYLDSSPLYNADDALSDRGLRSSGRPSPCPPPATTTPPRRDLGSVPDGLALPRLVAAARPARRPGGPERPEPVRPRSPRRPPPGHRPARRFPDGPLLVRLRRHPLDGPRRQQLRRLDGIRASGLVEREQLASAPPGFVAARGVPPAGVQLGAPPTTTSSRCGDHSRDDLRARRRRGRLRRHVHRYQRTKPLAFKVNPRPDGRMESPDGEVDGEWTLDDDYDEALKTVPRATVYVITGAGGDPARHRPRVPPRGLAAVHQAGPLDRPLVHGDGRNPRPAGDPAGRRRREGRRRLRRDPAAAGPKPGG